MPSSETNTLIHEFGHAYGAPDHYGDGDDIDSTKSIKVKEGLTTFDEDCIYGEDKWQLAIVGQSTICEGCQTKIMENIDRFQHELLEE